MSVISIALTPSEPGYPGPNQNEGTPSVLGDFGVGLPGSAGTSSVVYFSVTRTGDLSQFESVAWSVAGSGANVASGEDFVGGFLPGGIITFGPGESEAVIRVDIQTDFKPETTEQFTVQLSNPTSGVTLGTASVVATIVNDEPTVIPGTAGNDKFDQSAATVAKGFDLSQGGNDTAIGGSGDDVFYLGGALTSADSLTGGLGSDTLVLDGNYGSSTVTFGSKTIIWDRKYIPERRQ